MEITLIQNPDELEQDMRLLNTALSRIATDNGNRHDLYDVAAELGISLPAIDLARVATSCADLIARALRRINAERDAAIYAATRAGRTSLRQ